MKISGLNVELQQMAAPVPIWFARIALADWLTAARAVREAGGRLLALWGVTPPAAPASVCAAYVTLEGLLWFELPLAAGVNYYPDLVPFFPVAARMHRAIAAALDWAMVLIAYGLFLTAFRLAGSETAGMR